MSTKNKCEQYIREKLPRLKELNKRRGFNGRIIAADNEPKAIHLEHWLEVLGDKVIKTVYQPHNGRFAAYVDDGVAFYFGKDGQPLYEADWEALANLLNI